MSVSIQWQPTSDKWHSTDGMSDHASALRRAFGEDFTCLGPDDVQRLRGMEAMCDRTGETIFTELAAAIEEHGRIRIRMVW